MLTVVTWFWKPPGGRPAPYSAEHVNLLAAMVRAQYAHPHRFVCVTNCPAGIDPAIGIVHDDEDFAGTPSPEGHGMPSCYRRLRLFRDDAAAVFGDWIVSLDLDVVPVRDLAPLWLRRYDSVVLYRDPLRPAQANGSMFLLRAGSHPEVWNDFQPKASPALARSRGLRGSDQAWLSYCLPGAPRWGVEEGVYSFKAHVLKAGNRLPDDARMVIFHGRPKPWDKPRPYWVGDAFRQAMNPKGVAA